MFFVEQNEETVLMKAVLKGRTKTALALIKKGADVNASNKVYIPLFRFQMYIKIRMPRIF